MKSVNPINKFSHYLCEKLMDRDSRPWIIKKRFKVCNGLYIRVLSFSLESDSEDSTVKMMVEIVWNYRGKRKHRGVEYIETTFMVGTYYTDLMHFGRKLRSRVIGYLSNVIVSESDSEECILRGGFVYGI